MIQRWRICFLVAAIIAMVSQAHAEDSRDKGYFWELRGRITIDGLTHNDEKFLAITGEPIIVPASSTLVAYEAVFRNVERADRGLDRMTDAGAVSRDNVVTAARALAASPTPYQDALAEMIDAYCGRNLAPGTREFLIARARRMYLLRREALISAASPGPDEPASQFWSVEIPFCLAVEKDAAVTSWPGETISDVVNRNIHGNANIYLPKVAGLNVQLINELVERSQLRCQTSPAERLNCASKQIRPGERLTIVLPEVSIPRTFELRRDWPRLAARWREESVRETPCRGAESEDVECADIMELSMLLGASEDPTDNAYAIDLFRRFVTARSANLVEQFTRRQMLGRVAFVGLTGTTFADDANCALQASGANTSTPYPFDATKAWERYQRERDLLLAAGGQIYPVTVGVIDGGVADSEKVLSAFNTVEGSEFPAKFFAKADGSYGAAVSTNAANQNRTWPIGDDAQTKQERYHGTKVADMLFGGTSFRRLLRNHLRDNSAEESPIRLRLVNIAADSSSAFYRTQGEAPFKALKKLAQSETAVFPNIINISLEQRMSPVPFLDDNSRKYAGIARQFLALHNVLYVSAAGNGAKRGNGSKSGIDLTNVDENGRIYPAYLGSENRLIAVAAHRPGKPGSFTLASFSNRGAAIIDIAAPGCDLDTLRAPQFDSGKNYIGTGNAEDREFGIVKSSGTSFAAPLVSFALALAGSMRGTEPFDPDALALRLEYASAFEPNFNGQITGDKRLDIVRMMSLRSAVIEVQGSLDFVEGAAARRLRKTLTDNLPSGCISNNTVRVRTINGRVQVYRIGAVQDKKQITSTLCQVGPSAPIEINTIAGKTIKFSTDEDIDVLLAEGCANNLLTPKERNDFQCR